MFTKNIGIDLGTTNTRVYLAGRGVVIREPSVVAVNKHTETAKYIGREAKEIIGRTPGSIVPVNPLRGGVVADYDTTVILLQELIRRTLRGRLFAKARVLLGVPSGITPVERRAVRNAATEAGAKPILLVPETVAAAVGAGRPVNDPVGSMIVDIGGGTSEAAVLALGGIISSKSIRIGGDACDAAIVAFIRKRFNVMIGERTAETIKLEIGSAYPTDREETMDVKGRNVITGLPEEFTITSRDVREALEEPLRQIIDAIRYTLERTPPELAADLIEEGITLCGGGALLRGIDLRLHKETGLPVYIAEYPLDCVAEGTGKILARTERYPHFIMDDSAKLS